jgi:hypothetical protein
MVRVSVCEGSVRRVAWALARACRASCEDETLARQTSAAPRSEQSARLDRLERVRLLSEPGIDRDESGEVSLAERVGTSRRSRTRHVPL